jgi:hypothetical protein
MDRLSVNYFQTALASRDVEETESGAKVLKSMPVFRSGTFRDSMGEQHTWETEHLAQMVFHFNLLRDRDILVNVPVREGHPSLFGGGGSVMGYVMDLRVEGVDAKGNQLLVADMEITEPDAFGKIERGTLRARSSEIGFYETNDESLYWPVFMGVAWVDIPAVEGLFSKHQSTDSKFTPVRDEEVTPVGDASKHSQQESGDTTPPDPSAGNPEGQGQGAPSPGDSGSEPGDEAPPSGEDENEGGDGKQERSDHAAPPAGSFAFSLNGAPTTDFAAVQRHIDNLEAVVTESREQSRKDYVTSLAENHVIAATQIESMQAHAVSLTDEQYEAFKKMYDDAPSSPLFAHHGQGTVTEPGDDSASEIELLRERVAMHKRSGITDERLHETQSYKRLMELTAGKG